MNASSDWSVDTGRPSVCLSSAAIYRTDINTCVTTMRPRRRPGMQFSRSRPFARLSCEASLAVKHDVVRASLVDVFVLHLSRVTCVAPYVHAMQRRPSAGPVPVVAGQDRNPSAARTRHKLNYDQQARALSLCEGQSLGQSQGSDYFTRISVCT